jgi:type IX secretion system PorP/SprF family membrane protein
MILSMIKIKYKKKQQLSKPIYAFLIFSALNISMDAQDAIFSQFYNSNLYHNPAFAGMIDMSSISGVYRRQSIGTFNNPAFVSIGATYMQPSTILHGGAGVQVLRDMQAGNALSRTTASIIYSYRLDASNKVNVYSGFEVTIGQNNLNSSGLVFPDMIGNFAASSENIGNLSKIFTDFSVGFIGKYNFSFLGIAADHLTEPNISFNGNEQLLYRKYTIIAGSKFIVSDRGFKQEPVSIQPGFLFQAQESFQLLTEGTIINYFPFFLGLYIRENNNFQLKAIIFALGFHYVNTSLSYSYDLSIGKSSLQGYIAHEVTFSYQFKYNEKRKKMNAIKCPKI